MKTQLFLLLIPLMFAFEGWGQTWTYNFGTTTGTYSTAEGVSLTFLPQSEASGSITPPGANETGDSSTSSTKPEGTTSGITYTWIGENNASWIVAANWSPARTTPAITDILQFNDGTIKTVTAVPTETIGKLLVSGNTNITFQAGAIATLTVSNELDIDLVVGAGSQLNISGANALSISLSTGATGSISGSMTIAGAAHRLLATTASGITFNSGAVFTAGTGFIGNAFGSATANSIVFSAGSTYVHIAGSNPFGLGQPASVVIFQTGSLFRTIGTATPAFSGRTYADFEMDALGVTLSVTGTSAVSIDNVTLTRGTLNFNMTAVPGHRIKGNITVAAGATLNFNPATAGTVNLNGTTAQTISGGGTITAGSLSTLVLNNAAGVVLNTNASLHNLTVSSGSVFTINSGRNLTTTGTLTNNGTLTILSDNTGTGSLNHSTAGVVATVQRHIPNNNTWRFLSSPVAAQLLQPGFVPAVTPLPPNFDFLMFGETKTDGLPWINIRQLDNTLNPAFGTTFTVGRGYLVQYGATYPTTREFAGALNEGTINIPLTFTAAPGMQGWNLIGNPYPSSINWATVTRTMLEDNFYYIYDPTFGGGGGYVHHNGVSGIGNTSQFIAPHQGFFVKVTAGGTLELTNANRANSTQLWLKGNEEHPGMLALKLSHGSYWDEVRIAIGEGSDANRDRNDALKLFSFNPQMPQIYTRTDDQTMLALNTIPQLDENLVIPLSVVVPANGTMTLSLEELTGYFAGATVYLRDLKTNTIQNLNELPEYTFEGQTTDTDRFEIRFKAVGIAERNELPVRIWSDGQLLYVDLSQVQGSYGLQLTDLSGRLVLGQMLTGGSLQRVGVPVSTGVLIVRVAGNSGVVNRKVYIR